MAFRTASTLGLRVLHVSTQPQNKVTELTWLKLLRDRKQQRQDFCPLQQTVLIYNLSDTE